MKVLLSWLRDFAPIEGDPAALAEHLSDLGTAVERLDVLGRNLDGVVVARVLATRPHPNADKVQLVDVDACDGEALQIVWGAFNMAAGDLVPLATIGTVMPDGMEIGRRKVRGEWSNGMLCSAAELGLGDDHEGILILPPDLEPGAPLAEAMGIEHDVLFDLEVNPNRPDAMSVAGVARDLAARLGVPFAIPEPAVEEVPAELLKDVTVEVEAPDLCGRFSARVLRGVTVGPSDPVMARRLTLMGMRPINSLVDASNYVMPSSASPTTPTTSPAAGGGCVSGGLPGETLVTLDDVERTFTGDDSSSATPRPAGRHRGGHGRRRTRSTSRPPTCSSRCVVPAHLGGQDARACGCAPRPRPVREGDRPEIIDLAQRRLAELVAASGARPSRAASTCGAAARAGAGAGPTGRLNRLLGTA